MANLGDKSYNYSFYGLPDTSRVWGTPGVGGYAALTHLNLWGEYSLGDFVTEGVYWNKGGGDVSDAFGKPLDTTISLYNISKNSSFACNAIFSVETGDTLKPHYDVNVHSTDAPLAMCAVDTHGGAYGNFVRNPVGRYAYDVSYECNGTYTAPIYDIVYNNFCLQPNALMYDQAAPTTAPQGRALNSVAAYINAAPDTRDVCVIRPYLYRGAGAPRYRTADGIPPQVSTTYSGVPLIDTLTDRPIPATETYLRSKIKDNNASWRDDAVYSPFAMQLGINLFSTSTTPQPYDIASQLEIGFTRPFTVNALKTGAAQIDSGHRITAQYYRCNYDVKRFSDVEYQWENVIFDTANKVELNDGFNLNLLSNSTSIRFYTRLHIIDAKGNTKGKACELAIKHEIAMIGMYFADSVTAAEETVLGTSATGVYLPLYTGGVPNGEYVTGDDIPLQPHANAGSVADDTFKYVPDESEESGDSSTIINRGTIGSGATYYALTNAEMNNLSTWLNTTYQPTDQDTFIQDFKGMNPADYIASCVFYPFDIPLVSTNVPVVVGKLTAGGTLGATLNYEYGKLYDYGYYDIPMFGDFRDYLTQITVFVPFCGTVKLDPIMWAGHRLSVKMAIDWPTGICTGFIYRDNGMYDSVSGNIGVPLPLSAVANGSYQVAITNMLASHKAAHRSLTMGALGVAGGLATAAGGAATGNLKLAAGGLLSAVTGVSTIDSQADKMENIDYNIDHTQPSVTEVSGGSPFINCGTDLRVKILRTTPMMLPGYDASVYAKTIGFADCRTVKNLSGESGLTVCTNINTSGLTAPLEVIAELNKACKEGLIL